MQRNTLNPLEKLESLSTCTCMPSIVEAIINQECPTLASNECCFIEECLKVSVAIIMQDMDIQLKRLGDFRQSVKVLASILYHQESTSKWLMVERLASVSLICFRLEEDLFVLQQFYPQAHLRVR